MSRPIASFGNRVEAEIARAKLESEGILAAVYADDAGGYDPQFTMTRGVQVVVADKDAEEAIEILGLPAHIPDPPPPAPTGDGVTVVALTVAVVAILGLIVATVQIF